MGFFLLPYLTNQIVHSLILRLTVLWECRDGDCCMVFGYVTLLVKFQMSELMVSSVLLTQSKECT